MLTEFTAWLVNLVKQWFVDLWTFVVDAFINLLDLVLGAVVGLLALIPIPDFMAGGLAGIFGGMDPGILYFVQRLGVFTGFAMIGAAYGFKLVRKVVTLFQY